MKYEITLKEEAIDGGKELFYEDVLEKSSVGSFMPKEEDTSEDEKGWLGREMSMENMEIVQSDFELFEELDFLEKRMLRITKSKPNIEVEMEWSFAPKHGSILGEDGNYEEEIIQKEEEQWSETIVDEFFRVNIKEQFGEAKNKLIRSLQSSALYK